MARVLQEVEHGQGGKGGYRNGSGAAVTNFSALNQNAPKRRRERERERERARVIAIPLVARRGGGEGRDSPVRSLAGGPSRFSRPSS